VRLRPSRCLTGAALIAALLAFPGGPLAAQLSRRIAVGIVAGPTRYDLSGTGTTMTGGLRLDLTGYPFLVIELGLGYLHYRPQGGAGLTYLLPEISAQLQTTLGAARPYLGVGIGVAEPSSGTITSNLQTLLATAGVRIDVDRHWILRAEGRLRSVDPFKGSMLDVTAGIGRRF